MPVPSSTPQLSYVAVSPDMRELVHTLFVMQSDDSEVESVMPAYSAQLFSFVHGSGEIRFPDREPGSSTDFTLNAPMLQAAPMRLEGPVLNVGASFTPTGWAIFSGLDASQTHDTSFDADRVVATPTFAPVRVALERCRKGEISPEDYARAIEEMIRTVCSTAPCELRDEHRALLAAIEVWLESAFNPPLAQLYDSVEIGERQVQRLCRRFYGVPPAQLLKRYRAIRAGMLMAHGDLSPELRDEVLAAYFDQAHLIRDLRRYTGRTPTALSEELLAKDMLDPDGHGQSGRRMRTPR